MSISTASVFLASALLYLAAFATVLGGLGMFSAKLATQFGVGFGGKVSYVALFVLGVLGLLPATLLLDVDPTHLAIGAGAISLVSVGLWRFVGLGPGWLFELVILARRPAKGFWKTIRRRRATGIYRPTPPKRWVTRDQGEVENAMKVGGFWAVFCGSMDLWLFNQTFEITDFSGQYVFGAICVYLMLFFLFAGGAVQQPAYSDI